MKKTKIGTITIGQAPRSDIAPIIDAAISEQATCVHVGVLDGYSKEQILTKFAPIDGESLLTSKLLDGSSVVMGKSSVKKGLQEKIDYLESLGCNLILLLCTGEFNGISTKSARLLEPDHIIPPTLKNIVGNRKLGVLVPLAQQASSEIKKWNNSNFELTFSAASPYTATKEEIKNAALKLVDDGATFIVLDCFGYQLSHKAICKEVVDVPVVASSDLMINILKSLT